jgi:ribokinase
LIVVLGSINVDLVVRVAELARPGETVAGDDLALFPGGKGANQAVAAARAGAGVKMVVRWASDGFAEVARRGLELAGVDVGMVRIVPRPTGVAMIAVDRNGQNYITVAPGANFTSKPPGREPGRRSSGAAAEIPWPGLDGDRSGEIFGPGSPQRGAGKGDRGEACSA